MSIANFVQVITACEQASGPGMKDIIKAQLKTADTFCRFLVQQALDPFVVFGVKKYDAPTAYAAVDPSDAENSIKAVLSNLENRVITGNAAREAVTELLSMFSENTAKYLARVIDNAKRHSCQDIPISQGGGWGSARGGGRVIASVV